MDHIDITDLKVAYGPQVVLDIHSLSIPYGQSFGLVGNNGAGKTTLFKALLDLIKPVSGQVTIDNNKVDKDESWKVSTGAFLDEDFTIPFLRADEYFQLVARSRGISDEELKNLLEPWMDFFDGEIVGNSKLIRDLSKGNTKKVGIAAAFLGSPKLVVLDEPFANLDPSSQFRLRDILRKWQKEQGTTVLVSSHDLLHVAEISDRIAILDHGQVKKDMQNHADSLRELEAWFAGKRDTTEEEV